MACSCGSQSNCACERCRGPCPRTAPENPMAPQGSVGGCCLRSNSPTTRVPGPSQRSNGPNRAQLHELEARRLQETSTF